MDNLIFSLNATMPLFLLMMAGYVFRRTGMFDEKFALKLNAFVFKVSLPAMLFKDLATIDFVQAWDTRFVMFCFVITLISIGISAFIANLWKDKTIKGEYIQASYRSSAAILGLAFIQNIYGTSGMAPLMIIGSVPLYNIVAVIVLSVYSPTNNGRIDGGVIKKTALGILKNPIILGIVVGFGWSLLKLPVPTIMLKTVTSLGNCASPLGLISMGASIEISKIAGKLGPVITASFTKLLGFCVLFLPLAVYFGFRNEDLIAILVMLGSSTTVSSYVMAKNMGHEGTLTSGAVMLTTLMSAFTLTLWLFILRSIGYV